jgi:hypothetical protein
VCIDPPFLDIMLILTEKFFLLLVKMVCMASNVKEICS